MKKAIIAIVVAGVIVFATYKYLNKGEQAEGPKAGPIEVRSNDSLTNSIGASLQAYYSVKDAFVKSDTALVNQTALFFAEKIAAVDMTTAKADSTLVQTAQQYQETVAAESKKMVAAAGIEAKRKAFQATSDGLFDLLRIVRYSGSKVYQQHCPMAFDNAGANWLSGTNEIRNPYFGDDMLTCGSVMDSVSVQQ